MITFPKPVSRQYLDDNLKEIESITFHSGWKSEKCIECCGKKLKYHEGEPWVSVYECENCGAIMSVVRADRMGGNWSETVDLYHQKNEKDQN